MLHSIPAVAPSAPCFTRARAAAGPFTIGYAAFEAGDGHPVPHLLLPQNFPVLILDFDTGRALLTGPRAASASAGATTWGRGVSVGLTPGGAALLAEMPISEISGRTVEVDLSWATHLAELPSWAARFAWLDTRFSPRGDARFSPRGDARFSLRGDARWSPSEVVTTAWWRLQRTPRVSDVATALGVPRRRLERDFRRQIGLAPGSVARTARLQRSLTALLRGAPPAAAAVTGGFADQPHLTRTMRDLVGLTPAAFRAFVQDLTPARSVPSGA